MAFVYSEAVNTACVIGLLLWIFYDWNYFD